MATNRIDSAIDFFELLEGTWENKIDGKWRDDLGWNLISQPKLEPTPNPRFPPRPDPSYAKFEIHTMQMQEKIEFRSLEQPLRNVGRSGKAGFWLAKPYEVVIHNAKKSEGEKHELIHHEVGHFMMKVKNDKGEEERKNAVDIIRQATIPRGNAMLTSGKLRSTSIREAQGKYNAKPSIMSVNPTPAVNLSQQKVDDAFKEAWRYVLERGGPDFTKPLEWLAKWFPEKPAGSFEDWVFEFRHNEPPSEMSSGQRVEKPVNIGHLLSEFWVSQRKINDSPQTLLQYAQVVDLEFHGFKWPHVAVNTLIKQP